MKKPWGLGKRIISFSNVYSRMSFKSAIMWMFIPIIIFSISITGFISFTLAKYQIQENTYSTVNDIVMQTKSYLDNRMYDAFEQFVYLENDTDLIEIESKASENLPINYMSDAYLNINKKVNTIYASYSSIIDSIFINLNNGWFVIYKNNYLTSQVNFSFEDLKKEYGKSNYYWLNIHKDNLFLNQNKSNNVTSLFKLFGDNNSKLKGFINFNFSETFFKNILEKPKISENGYLVLISEDGVMQFKNVDEKYQMNTDIINQVRNFKTSQGDFEFKIPGRERMLVSYNTLKINNWKIAAVIPQNEILSKTNYIKYITLFLVIFLIIIGLFLSNFIARIISKPISDLTKKVKKIKDGELEEIFHSDSSNEVGILSNVMNELIARVKTLLVQVRAEQELKRNAQFLTLQAQINPHFLYNTLYAIKQLSDLGESKDASMMISALSNFFRIGISRGKEVIKIQEEFEHIKNYFLILHMRYSDDFVYKLEIDPDILNCKIIKLILQPLVENAIYHGVKNKRGQGLILVKGIRVGDNVEIDVIDDGAGMTQERLKEIKESLLDVSDKKYTLSFGLRNVNDRLTIQYGRDYGIKLFSELGVGTTIRVTIPYEDD